MAEIKESSYKPVIDITSFSEEDYAVIEIADNGPGMMRNVLKRVFEPFYTTKEVGKGTGLGLSVSYFIITNNHSGIFTAESEPGAGACFIIKLPLD
jgi:signal transduction histidine kinase